MSHTTPRLSEVARHIVVPAGIVSTGWPRVRDTITRLGWEFDDWQAGAGYLILAKNENGLYAARSTAMSIARQVGKTWMVACIIFALCLIYPGLTVIWTAHHSTTSAETFDMFAGMAERPQVKPHIKPGRGGVKRGRGSEQILFRNGSRILFGARDGVAGFGRGKANIGVLVFDEAQMLKPRAMEDLAATQNAAQNPLKILIGTPPRPGDHGEVFSVLRQRALDGVVDDTLYIEFSADRDGDPMDRVQWRKANPSFPHRTSELAMVELHKMLTLVDSSSWNREALGIWDEVSVHQAVITDTAWRGLIDVGPVENEEPDAIGVDMSHGLAISVGACWIEDESAHVEEIWAGTDVDAAVDFVELVAGRRIDVLIDDISPASQMVPALKARGVRVRRTNDRDMAKACMSVESRAKAERLTHADQKALNDSVKGARKRPIATAGGWGWDRRDSTVVIHPLVAITLALLGAIERHRPTRGRGREGTAQ